MEFTENLIEKNSQLQSLTFPKIRHMIIHENDNQFQNS